MAATPTASAREVRVIGTSIGPYRVISRLGAGGMGEVFLGHDTRLDRRVALKRLTRLPDDAPAVRSRVLAEARAAARLNHPHIAAVYDVVEDEGRPFIVMEYVAGESLAARLARGRLALDEALSLGRQLASAVAAAHAQGVIHRDLKPGNVQITADGSVKVLDFGIAKVAPRPATTSSPTASRLSTAGSGGPVGTIGYMSPEQLLNDPVDARSDVYTLGLILFEVAVGRPPFAERDAIGRAMAIASGAPPRADRVDSRVPPALGAVIAKAMARERGDRYQSARELARALDGLARAGAETAAMPVTAGPDTAPLAHARGAPWSRRALVGAAVLLGAPVLVTALGFANTAAFNVTLQRPAPFSSESLVAYFTLGYRSLVAPAIYLILFTVVVDVFVFGVRLFRVVPPVDRALTATATQTRHAAARLGFDDPVTRAQAVTALMAIAFALVTWYYWDLIAAFTSRIAEAPPQAFAPLRTENARHKDLYGIVLDVLTAVSVVAVLRTRRFARRRGAPTPPVLAVAGGLVLVFLLMNALPYRVMWQNRFERISLAGARCYVIGEHDERWLVYCPDDPPRNRIIERAHPAIERTGVVENIFSPAGP